MTALSVVGSVLSGVAQQALGEGVGVPSNNRFILMGDSRAAADYGQSSGLLTLHASTGIGAWIETLTQHRVRFLKADSVAVGGSTSEDLNTASTGQVALAIAKSAANVLLLTSINDQGANNWPGSRSIAALQTAINALLAAGKWLYIVTELPRGSTGFTGTRFTSQQESDHQEVRDWLNALNHPRIMLIDAYAAVSDADTGLATDYAAKMTYDGVHPSSFGAYTIAAQVTDRMVARFRTPDAYAWNILDTYNASTNPDGNLIANSEMSGTSGTGVNGSTVLGSMATGFAASVGTFTGLTATCSKVADADGNSWQQVRVQGNSGAGFPLFAITRNITFANVTTGDILDARGDWEADAGQVGLVGVGLGLLRLNTGATKGYSIAMARASAPYPDVALSERFRIGESVAIVGDENTVQIAMYAYISASTTGVDFTVRFRHPFIGKIAAGF